MQNLLSRWSKSRFLIPCLLAIALIGLCGMGMTSTSIKSVTFRAADSNDVPREMNAPYMALNNTPQDVAVTLNYPGYGNTVFQIVSPNCFKGGYTINGIHHTFPNKGERTCGEFLTDFSSDLHKGENIFTTTVVPRDPANDYSPIVGLCLGNVLWGKSLVQGFFTGLFLTALLSALAIWLLRQGFNRIICAIFISACIIYLQGWHITPDFSHTQDAEKHLSYLQFVSDDFFHPYDYKGPEFWHPPLYYWLTAVIVKFMQFWGAFDVWEGICALSFVCQLVLLYYTLRIMQHWFSGHKLYLAFMLFAFWPAMLTSAAWFYNDVILYPLYAMVIYYGLLWYEQGPIRHLRNALFACALCFMIKTSALVPAGILGSCVLFKLITRQYDWRQLLNKEIYLAAAANIFGILFLLARSMYTIFVLDKTTPSRNILGGYGGFNYTPDQLLIIDVRNLFAEPFLLAWKEPFMWNELIKTLMFNEFHWPFAAGASYMTALFLLLLVYALVALFTLPRERWVRMFPLASSLILPLVASVGFLIACHNIACMDFRYVRPAVAAFAMFFVYGIERTKEKNWPALYYLGSAAAWLLIGISLVTFEQLYWYALR